MKKFISKIFNGDFSDKVVGFHLLLLPIFTMLNLYTFELIPALLIGGYCLLVICNSVVFIVEYDNLKERLRRLENEKAQSSDIHKSID